MKKLLSITIFSGLLLLSVSAAHAQGSAVRAQDAVRSQDAATIKYLGTQDDQVIFNIAYDNPQSAPFNLIVKDQDGSELYQHSFHDRNFHKQFRLPRTEKTQLSFIIRKGKDADIVKNFEINVSSRVIQDFAVKKLD